MLASGACREWLVCVTTNSSAFSAVGVSLLAHVILGLSLALYVATPLTCPKNGTSFDHQGCPAEGRRDSGAVGRYSGELHGRTA